MNDFGLSTKEINIVRDILKKYPSIVKVVVFGSRATNTYKVASDIDLAVWFDDSANCVDGVTATECYVSSNQQVIGNLLSDFDDSILPYFVDVIDYCSVSSDALRRNIDRDGKMLYRRGWEEVRLGDVVEDIKHGYPFLGEFITNDTTENILVTPGNFKIGGGFKAGKFKYYKSDVPEKYILNAGDVIVTMTDLSKSGDTIGFSAIVPKSINCEKYLHNQRIGLVTIGSNNKIDKLFLYWLLRNKDYQKFIVNTSTGTTVKHTSPKLIKSYQFYMPPPTEQTAIANILSSLDDKIELLREQNKTLEAIAQAIFKHWFIDFNFPDENGNPYKDSGGAMVDSEMGLIPRGWRVGKLSDEFNITMGQSPIGNSYNDMQNGMLFFQGRADFGDRFPKNRIYTTAPKRMAHKFDVLLSVRAPVGDINIALNDCCIGRGLAAINSIHNSYCYYKILSVKSSFDIFNGTGTVFGSINKEQLISLQVIVPNIDAVNEFDQIVNKIDQNIYNNYQQILNLEKLQDLLLPKLMSGDILVPNKRDL